MQTREAIAAADAVIFRRMKPADLPRLIDLTLQAFAADAGAARQEEIVHFLKLAYGSGDVMRFEHGYVAEQRGHIVSKCQLLDLPMRLGCVTLRVAGFHALVTDKAVATRSLILPIVRYGFQDAVAHGFDIGLGFTQHRGVFRLIGSVTVAAEHEFSLAVADLPRDGRLDDFNPVQPADVPLVIDYSNRASQGRVLSLVRNQSIWQQLERRPAELWLSKDCYLGLRRSERGIEVRDVGVAANDARIYDRALAFLAELARVGSVGTIFGEWPEDHGLVVAAKRYGAKCKTLLEPNKGCMAGIINFEGFLQHIVPELSARARLATSTPVLLRIECEKRLHELQLGGPGVPATTVRFVGSRGLLLKLVLGSAAHLELVAGEPGAQLMAEGTAPDVIDALFAARLPFVGLCDRW